MLIHTEADDDNLVFFLCRQDFALVSTSCKGMGISMRKCVQVNPNLQENSPLETMAVFVFHFSILFAIRPCDLLIVEKTNDEEGHVHT